MNIHDKTLDRYAREHRLALAIARYFKSQGYRVRVIRHSETAHAKRHDPVNLFVMDRLPVLVRVAGELTMADRAFMARNPAAVVLSSVAEAQTRLDELRRRLPLPNPPAWV